jgi:hypothetical protein
MRAVEVEHVRISWDGGSQVGHGRFLPLLVERLAVNVAQSHGRHTASGDIEAGGNADDIEIMVSAIFKLNASFIEGDDGVVLDIDDVDVVAVELLEVSVFQTWALHTPRMGRLQRGEDIAFLGVIHSSALLLGPEIVDFAVGFGVVQVVLVVPKPVAEAAVGPQPLEELVTLFGGIFKASFLRERIEEAAEATFAKVEEFGIPLLAGPLLLGCESTEAHRHRQVWCSLENLEVACHGAPCLGDLDARSAGADDSALLPLHIDLLVRPEGRVMNNTLELLDSEPARDVSLSCEARGDDEVLGLGCSAVCCLDRPTSFVRVELGFHNNTFEGSMALNVKDLVTVIKVITKLLVPRVVRWPGIPRSNLDTDTGRDVQAHNVRFPSFWNRQLVFGNFGVDHGPSCAKVRMVRAEPTATGPYDSNSISKCRQGRYQPRR